MKTSRGLSAHRRHVRTCQFFGPGGRDVPFNQCACPFHVDGKHESRRPRFSLKTSNRTLADRKVAELTRKIDEDVLTQRAAGSTSKTARPTPNIAEAVELFLGSYGSIDKTGKTKGDLKYSSWRKYRNSLEHLRDYCQSRRIHALGAIDSTDIEQFRNTRDISPRTWKTELQSLRTFFTYCVGKRWIATNCAKEVKSPRNLTPNDVVPYTLHEEVRILAACDRIGGGRCAQTGGAYERLRAKAVVLTLRHTALRISDVIQLRKDAISWDAEKGNWRIRLRTKKTGEAVHLPIPNDLKQALDALPQPRNSAKDCPYFFWNGNSSERAVLGIAERTLSRVFQLAGVEKAHAHRYRHTLATRLLASGSTYELVADILGNTPEVVRKHYAKWSQGRQDNIDRAMSAHFLTALDTFKVTNQSHENIEPVN